MSDLFQKPPGKKQPQAEYTAQDIEVLEGLEPVRRRPGMYIGGTDDNALHHLVAEVFDNAMDEAVAGYARSIEITLQEDGSLTVRDDGRGIPIDPHPKYPKKSALEVILTTLHSGGKFNNKVYYTSGGLHGVGISVVNALSERLEVNVLREGKHWQQTYSRGEPTSKLTVVGEVGKKTGTEVTFLPDAQIFGEKARFRPARLYKLAVSKAYLFKGVTILWRCKATEGDVPEEKTIHFPNGLQDYLAAVLEEETPISQKPFSGEVMFDDGVGRVEWAVQWVPSKDMQLQSYCNTVTTSQGGTHEQGLRSAILRGLREFGELTNNRRAAQLTSDDVLSGMQGVLSLFIRDPQFQGQTKEKLANREAVRLVENAMKDSFDLWLSQNKNEAMALLEFVVEQAEERLRRKEQRDVSRKSATQRLRLPGKLADCSRQTPEGTELFLVEGDSAGGSAKMARNRETQAILPLRGKILNVASATNEKIRANQELSDLALALGCGEGQHYDASRLRYEKIVIMTDADVDGAHIASLLMTYFFRSMPQLIRDGHLYLACPPLYRLTQGGKAHYVHSDEERKAKEEELRAGRGQVDVTRFKGLGEMTPSQLKETTMNPATRTLLKVIIDGNNQEEASLRVEELMGKKAELRYKFITEQSATLSAAVAAQLDV